MIPSRSARRAPRGAALVFAVLLMLVLAVVAAGILRYAGGDRVAAARMVVRLNSLTCAEAGLQYARRLLACNYTRTGGWNDYLTGARPGRLDKALGDLVPDSLDDVAPELKGDADDDGALDPGADLDEDGKPDFWISVRDDDDERPTGAADDRNRDNNLAVLVRSECTNEYLAREVGGRRYETVVEALVTYIPGSTRYGTAPSSSNAMEAATSGNWVNVALPDCE